MCIVIYKYNYLSFFASLSPYHLVMLSEFHTSLHYANAVQHYIEYVFLQIFLLFFSRSKLTEAKPLKKSWDRQMKEWAEKKSVKAFERNLKTAVKQKLEVNYYKIESFYAVPLQNQWHINDVINTDLYFCEAILICNASGTCSQRGNDPFKQNSQILNH